MRPISIAAGALFAVMSATSVFAQAPAPAAPAVPEKMPFDTPYGMAISYDHAANLINAVAAESKKRGWKMNIAVVDTNGDLIAFQRMDGAQIASVKISQGKASTAARFRRPSEIFFKAFESGHPYVSTLDPTLVASPGGFPLVEGGKLVGGIGCSGGTGDQDALVCKVGADMMK